MKRPHLRSTAGLLAALAFAVAGCDAGQSDGSARVAVRFAIAEGDAARASARTSSADSTALVVEGPNGTLRLTELALVVTTFRLKPDEAACADSTGGRDEDDRDEDDRDDDDKRNGDGDDEGEGSCGSFRLAPRFVALPLGGGAVEVAADDVPSGRYRALRFRVDDLDLDEKDEDDEDGDDDDNEDDDRSDHAALAVAVRQAYPAWPDDASLVAVGSFTPTGGSPRPFTAFAEADIDVRMAFDPPIDVDGAQALRIEVDPAAWFRTSSGGAVTDLSAYDHAATGRLFELDVRVRDGFGQVERDDDDDDEDDDGDDD